MDKRKDSKKGGGRAAAPTGKTVARRGGTAAKKPAAGFARGMDEPSLAGEMDEPAFMRGRDVNRPDKPKPAVRAGGAKRGGKQPGSPMQRALSIAVAVIATAGLLAVTFFVFCIKTISVVGITKYTSQQIIAMSGLAYNRQIFLSDLSKAREAIEQDPYLHVISIARILPNKIHIEIEERQEIAAIAYQNLVVVIARDGYVLSIGNRADLSGLIQVNGIQGTGYSVNQRLGELTDFYTNTLISILQALQAHGLHREIASLDISNPLSVHMVTVQGLDVKLGQSGGIDEKLISFAKILPDLKAAGITRGTLHLSEKNDPVYSPPGSLPPAPQPEPEQTPRPDSSPGPQA